MQGLHRDYWIRVIIFKKYVHSDQSKFTCIAFIVVGLLVTNIRLVSSKITTVAVLAISRLWCDAGFRNWRINFVRFFIFLFKNTEMRLWTLYQWCVLPCRDSSPLKTMLEFMRRQSLERGVIHYSFICILVTDLSFYVGSLLFRRSVPQQVR